jgi:CheY-like chemotaxis protein
VNVREVTRLAVFQLTWSEGFNADEGVEVALRTNPDLILGEIALPQLDGCGVARRLKAESTLNGVPLVAVTASAMVGDRDKVVTSGFDGYISKPITPETFVAEVEAYFHPREGHGDHSGR